MSAERKRRYVYRPTLSRTGKWIVRKVLFRADRYDTYSTLAEAECTCKRNTAHTAQIAHRGKKAAMRDRFVDALRSATAEDLELARELLVDFLTSNRW